MNKWMIAYTANSFSWAEILRLTMALLSEEFRYHIFFKKFDKEREKLTKI